MVIKVISVGKTKDKTYSQMHNEYLSKLKHYGKVEYLELNPPKLSNKISEDEQKKEEAKVLLMNIKSGSKIILLDKNGEQLNSRKFAKKIEQWQISSIPEVCFVIGGPYGFSDDMYSRSNGQIGLSKMTFTHQMVRLFFLEQLYRAFTIIKGEKYHH